VKYIDRYVVDLCERKAPKTVSLECSALRAFLRYLHVVGMLKTDMSRSVPGLRIRRAARPPRVLSRAEVKRLLGVIDQRTDVGKRDYAALLFMASYGMGVSEVMALRLYDFDWRAATFRFVRPKTQVEVELPLLAPAVNALAAYLRHGRPQCDSAKRSRAVFLDADLGRKSVCS
jgi:integrase/recombinase XerD